MWQGHVGSPIMAMMRGGRVLFNMNSENLRCLKLEFRLHNRLNFFQTLLLVHGELVDGGLHRVPVFRHSGCELCNFLTGVMEVIEDWR